jgi:heat shock protein HslJ
MTRTCLLRTALLLATSSIGFGQDASGEDGRLVGVWQLARYEGPAGRSRTLDDPSRYTLEFQANGSLVARIDCNRGRGGWIATEAGRLELRPLVLTRMMCVGQSLHDQILEHWSRLHTYALRNGRLVLSVDGDGGAYEFEPAPAEASSAPRK